MTEINSMRDYGSEVRSNSFIKGIDNNEVFVGGEKKTLSEKLIILSKLEKVTNDYVQETIKRGDFTVYSNPLGNDAYRQFEEPIGE